MAKNQKKIFMLIKANPAPGILGESPQLPTPHERELLPHEKKMPRATEKLPKGSKGLQYKRTQKK